MEIRGGGRGGVPQEWELFVSAPPQVGVAPDGNLVASIRSGGLLIHLTMSPHNWALHHKAALDVWLDLQARQQRQQAEHERHRARFAARALRQD